MSERKFVPEELILVDNHELVDHERWVPGIYLERLDEQRHLVEIMVNGKREVRGYKTMCLRHADEAYDLDVKYEVYADCWRGSDLLSYDGVDAEPKALAEAKKWSTESENEIVVDRIVVSGSHPYRTYVKGEQKDC